MVKAEEMAAKIKADESNVWHALAVGRILLGFVFLWAFFDKLLGLGFATPAVRAWLNGGSPTKGFLSNVDGPFAEFFMGMAGAAWADWLFMIGLLGIGLALVVGAGVRIAAIAGSTLLILMWMASLPLETNPVIDDHVVYIALLAAIAFGLPWQRWSLAKWWQSFSVVKKQPWLW